MFKKKKGIRLPYYQQGFIYFLCANFYRLPASVQERIRSVVDRVGGVHCDALFYLLVHPDTNTTGVYMKFYVSERKLYKLRNAFYEAAAKELLGASSKESEHSDTRLGNDAHVKTYQEDKL